MKKLGIALLLALAATLSFAADLSSPVLVTSIGQSADLHTARLMLKKAGVDTTTMTIDKLAGAAKVPANGTVAMVVGASNKGLGEARISADAEITRAKELIAAAKTAKAKVLLIHIGGKERRGGQSDGINKAVAEAADILFVKKDGDDGEFFTKIAKTTGKKIVVFQKIPDGITELKKEFGK